MTAIAPETLVLSQVGCTGDTHPVQENACRYQVAWTINPHMRVGAVDCDQARRQHAALVSVLSTRASIEVLPFVHGALDCVFAKDNALLIHDGLPRALMAHPRFGERRSEQVQRAVALAARGFEVHAAPEHPFEGGDVVMLPSGGALLGIGPRTDPRSREHVERFLGQEVIALSLRDPHLYHLDTALAVLGDGTALLCPEALTGDGLATIERMLARGALRRVLSIPRGEAMAFATNVVEVGDAVVTGTTRDRAPITARALESIGREVIEVPLDQFHLAGGSAACLVARVSTQRARLRSSVPTGTLRACVAPSLFS